MTEAASEPAVIRPSEPSDLPAICVLIQPFVDQRILLARSEDEMALLASRGFVAEVNGEIVGFVALEIYSRKLAELQCLAVAGKCQGQGIGKRLVRAVVELARANNVVELMAITASEQLFYDCGFHYALPDQKKAVFINP